MIVWMWVNFKFSRLLLSHNEMELKSNFICEKWHKAMALRRVLVHIIFPKMAMMEGWGGQGILPTSCKFRFPPGCCGRSRSVKSQRKEGTAIGCDALKTHNASIFIKWLAKVVFAADAAIADLEDANNARNGKEMKRICRLSWYLSNSQRNFLN